MEFSGQYLTYDEYRLLGGTLDIMPFNLLEFNARKKIDEKTMNRLIGIETIPQEVKVCVYELINVLESYESDKTRNKAISSENTDGYSVTYNNDVSLNSVAKNSQLESVIDDYLFGVVVNGEHIIYCGI